MSVAELEIENRYREATHDGYFDGFDETALTPRDLEPFPSCLVCLRNGHRNAAAKNRLIEAISSGLPVKVLLQRDDILEDLPIAGGKFAFGIESLQLPAMALGLNTAYVVQASGSHLHAPNGAIDNGMRYHGPALFSVFSGAGRKASRAARNAPGLGAYLRSAAAMESRAFPVFSYDSAARADWAARFRVADNPQAEADWPVHGIAYEDEDLQWVTEEIAFTFVDFVARDKRYAECFAPVSRGAWHGSMVPTRDFLALNDEEAHGKVPYVLLVDESNRLHRAVVNDRLIDAARRCAAFWRGLQELGGIGNSHAQALLEKEKAAWAEAKARDIEASKGGDAPATEQPVADVPVDLEAAAVVEAPAPVKDLEAVSPDEAYIETPRCTTCHECIEINTKMFAYDDNMQAYLTDLEAGSFRQLVEAAENCQVAIIHPENRGTIANPAWTSLSVARIHSPKRPIRTSESLVQYRRERTYR